MADVTQQVLKLLQSKEGCFKAGVCSGIPCACAEEIATLAAPGIPTAWMRGVSSPSTPHGPAEYDVDLVYGDDAPEGDGWIPLYREPRPFPSPPKDGE